MSNKCSTCGAPVPDRTAVFCNRCGSRLPAAPGAEIPACRACGRAVTDRQARFCDGCGSPLAPAVPAASPAPPAVQRRNCPACGFGNFGGNLFYCRKCGAILPKFESVTTGGQGAKTPSGKPRQVGISIIPDGMDEFRQQPVNALGAARQPSVDAPVALRRPPAHAEAEARVLSQKPPQEASKLRDREYWRRISIIAAWILLILLIIAAIVMIVPKMLDAGSENTTVPDTTVPDTTDPDLPAAILDWIIPDQATVDNQGTAVLRDTP